MKKLHFIYLLSFIFIFSGCKKQFETEAIYTCVFNYEKSGTKNLTTETKIYRFVEVNKTMAFIRLYSSKGDGTDDTNVYTLTREKNKLYGRVPSMGIIKPTIVGEVKGNKITGHFFYISPFHVYHDTNMGNDEYSGTFEMTRTNY
jgi:hypothetical protein